MSHFHPVNAELFFSKQDADDRRLGEIAKADAQASPAAAWVIAGYPDDEGIRLNGGRPGAAQGPSSIRRWLYKMTPDPRRATPVLVDRGDLKPSLTTLAGRHEIARAEASRTLRAGAKWLGLGGGHDYGFPDGAGFLDAVGADARPLLINFDAHLDVRPLKHGFHSGTPFRRLLEEFKNVEFVEIGIQSQCNSRSHLEWLREHNAQVLFLDDLTCDGKAAGPKICETLLAKLERPRPVFLSIDMDVFSQAFAPGCSQSWPFGLHPEDVMLAIDFVCARADVRAAGFYEVAPPLDQDDRTVRLAAQLAHRLIHNRGPRG